MPIVLSQLGTAKAVVTDTYTLLLTGTTSHVYTVRLHFCPSEAGGEGTILNIYVAANSWASGQPSGSTLVEKILDSFRVYGTYLSAPFMVSGTEKVVVAHSNGSMIEGDFLLYGTDYS